MKLQPANAAARKNYAAAAARSGKRAEATEIWRDTVRANPEDVVTRGELAGALYDAGDYEGARYQYKEILRRKPNSANALNGIGLLHLRELKLPQAEAAFRGAINANTSYVAAYNNLAIVMEKLNRRPQAISLLERAAKIDPRNADVQRNLRRLKSDS
ncbi:tetratricopeptide repeat protein [bacterium]|nr:MAG: tetratricopeptide repeat protein [bacterium]